MISCAEVREELVAALRGEVSAEVARAVESHVARCAACAAEREDLRRTMAVVRRHVHPEPSTDARRHLRAAIAAELAKSRRRRGWRTSWSALALPTAVAAGALVAWWAAPVSTPGVASVDPTASSVARTVAGAAGPKAMDAASRGLAWLLQSQADDGTWAPAAGPETTAAVTASALLAFEANGQSPHVGPNAAALKRANDRLARLVAAGFSDDDAAKPLYAQALGVRALASAYRLDSGAMTSDDRRASRETLVEAGRRLVRWQGSDGGFGYVPRAPRSDASCTLFAVAALSELREAGVTDASAAMRRASGFLATLRGRDGTIAYMRPGDRRAAPTLTAALLSWPGASGVASEDLARALSSIEEALPAGNDALLAWTGFEALARHGRSLDVPVKDLLAGQRPDGAWTAVADVRCAAAGDAVTTAFGVLALTQTYAR